jgi:hypothetical protein
MFGNNGKRLVRLFGARITFSSEEHRFVVKKFAVKKTRRTKSRPHSQKGALR